MKIVVCVKQIIDPEQRLRLDPQTDLIDEAGIFHVINPRDLFALEQALAIREATRGTEVAVLSMGPQRVKDALIECLAMGADAGYHLWDDAFAGSDIYATSITLARAIEKIGYDVILCGRVSADDNGQQAPAAVAQILGIPLVSGITRLEIDENGKRAVVHRAMPKGDREVIECALPAIFSVEADINRPRYPRLRLRLQAREKGLDTWGCDVLGLRPDEVGSAGSMIEVKALGYPKPRTKKVEKPDANLPPHLRLQWLMQGGAAKKPEKDDGPFEGPPQEAAARVFEMLTEEKLLPSLESTHSEV